MPAAAAQFTLLDGTYTKDMASTFGATSCGNALCPPCPMVDSMSFGALASLQRCKSAGQLDVRQSPSATTCVCHILTRYHDIPEIELHMPLSFFRPLWYAICRSADTHSSGFLLETAAGLFWLVWPALSSACFRTTKHKVCGSLVS